MDSSKIIVSKPNRALVVPRTRGMIGLFPEGKPLDDRWWIIPHGLAEYILLRRLGFRLPNPISCYYDWAGGSPFSVQKITCSMLTASPRAYVLNDMGTGKTRATLWAWDYLYGNGYCGKMLVVGPLSTRNLVWGHEVNATIPHRKMQILHGTKKQRLARLADSEADLFFINHDGVKVILDALKARKDIDVLALDELAKYRNNNDRSKAMLGYAQNMKFVWGLTGSPMPNEPTDVWMQCRILTPHTVPRYKTHARDMLMTRKSEYLWIPKPDAVERAYSWMQPAVRFTLDDVVELPDLVERYIDVPLSPEQDTAYTTVVRDLTIMINNQEIKAFNAAAEMNKLLQISGGYVYDSNGKEIKLDATSRKELLRDLINQATGKVIVYFPFRHMVEGVHEFFTPNPNLKDQTADPNYIEHAVIHGDIAPGERDKIFYAFQKTDQYKALLAHPVCMSHGLTLTAADTIIWYCPLADLEVYEQANARIRRVGQKHRQQVLHLQGTPIERKVYALLRRKANIQEKLLSLFEEATSAAQSA